MKTNYSSIHLNSLGFTVLLAGLAGGMIEIGWISIYSSLSSINVVNIAQQISATIMPLTVNSDYAPMLGIFIHLALSLILATLFSAIILKPAVRRYGALGIMLSSFMTLGIVWAINFFIVLPILNPSFVLLMPYMVTLISKLLFGAAMGWVMVNSSPYTKYITK
jgi:hypothetical protein